MLHHCTHRCMLSQWLVCQLPRLDALDGRPGPDADQGPPQRGDRPPLSEAWELGSGRVPAPRPAGWDSARGVEP